MPTIVTKNRIEKLFEEKKERILSVYFSAGFPGLNDTSAIMKYLDESGADIIEVADLSQYFETIPHAKLMDVVAERIADGAVLALIQQWLKAPVVETDRRGTTRRSGGKGQRRGTPQGGVISPLLANLYLHVLDRAWARPEVGRGLRAKLVRYADDLVVLCAREVEPSLTKLRQLLGGLGLSLNEEKMVQ